METTPKPLGNYGRTGGRPILGGRHRPWQGDDPASTRRQPYTVPVPVEAIRVGQTFGRLQVLDPNRRRHGKRSALCRCSCGTEKVIRTEHLRSGGIQSCGCLRAEQMETWRRLREDDDAEVAAARSRADERVSESDLLHLTLIRLNLVPPV